MILAFLTLAAAAGPAGCRDTLPAQALDALVERSLTAYANGESQPFEAALREAQAVLPCVLDVINPITAANLHLAEALLHHQSGLDDAAAYREAWARGQWATFPSPTLLAIAQRTPAFLDLQAPEVPTGESLLPRRRLPPALTGEISVNGRFNASDIPRGAPYLFQIVRPSGGVTATVYVRPGAPVPAYPQLRPVLTTVALGAAALSAAGLVTATVTHEQLFTENWVNREPRELLELQSLNQAAVVTSIGAGALSLGAAAGLAWSFR